MDVFIAGIPSHVTQVELESTLQPSLSLLGITQFKITIIPNRKGGNKSGVLTLPFKSAAEKFLERHGKRPGQHVRNIQYPIRVGLQILAFSRSRNSSDPFVVRRLQQDTQNKPPRKDPKKASVVGVDCGYWDYDAVGRLVFCRAYQRVVKGSMTIGRKALSISLCESPEQQDLSVMKVDYPAIHSLRKSPLRRSSILITLRQAPRFYKVVVEKATPDLSRSIQELTLATAIGHAEPKVTTSRELGLDQDHELVVEGCFVYHIGLRDAEDYKEIKRQVQGQRGAPRFLNSSVAPKFKDINFNSDMTRLLAQLSKGVDMPFSLKFHLQRLARNGILSPKKALALYVPLLKLLQEFKEMNLVEGLQHLYRSLPDPEAEYDGSDYMVPAMVETIRAKAQSFNYRTSIYHIAKQHDHVALVYKAYVSPVSIWLQGPELEVKNRVLRKYPQNVDHFLRVTFCDEDGEQVSYESKVDRVAVFRMRFKNILDKGLPIAGQSFMFLGFSHSSLRLQTCWFMSAFVHDGSLLFSKRLIEGLGDFEHITCPAKCAARIGQAFSDASDTINVERAEISEINDISRNGRCFTDGVGTISKPLLKRVWKRFFKSRKAYAKILQIRCKGLKGLLVLDPSLEGEVLKYRPSMNKFESPNHWDLEITGASYHPLPMYLNRQFINIMECLGTDTEVFIALQERVLSGIEEMTKSADGAAAYLESNKFGMAIGLPGFIRDLARMGLDYMDDSFLKSTVEIATRVQLRELKHKARIPVENAHTLYGIVDETGHLQPNEVHVLVDDRESAQSLHRTGPVLITRAPALHPGDFQMVNAVAIPPGSPNNQLHNCVIFSQHGIRDIPSMLSGGDLDGDIFNVIFDARLFPKKTCEPADYTAVKPADLNRRVEITDMSDFFLDFMEQDKLGYICNSHMVIADQKPEGVFSEPCLKLAQMASTAVDFSKTGVSINMADFPNDFDRRMRPDFMATAPHLVLNTRNLTIDEDDTEMLHHDVFDEVDDVLNTRTSGYRYYESPKILGRLYRNIDETKFLKALNVFDVTSDGVAADASIGIEGVIWSLWTHMTTLASTQIMCDWDTASNQAFARNVMSEYNDGLADIMYQYSPHQRNPVSELEVFCGTILGREGSMPSKRTRERNIDMKDNFERWVRETREWIRVGDYDEEPESYDETLGEDERDEPLERSIACLSVAVHESGKPYSRDIGHLRSFVYVAASACLKELEKYEQLARKAGRQKGVALGPLN